MTMSKRCNAGGPSQSRYLALDLPPTFILEIRSEAGIWSEWGAYRAKDFERLEDGTYVCAGHGGSPTWLRCIAHRDGYFEHVDGGGQGQVHAYRITPVNIGGR